MRRRSRRSRSRSSRGKTKRLQMYRVSRGGIRL